LEISGAICARVIHDLSNLTSGIIGNAEYAQNAGANSENLQKAIHAISLSANSAGKLLGQCLPLQRLVSGEAFSCETADMAAQIAEASTLASGWSPKAPSRLTGQVRVQPRWLAATVWQIARETEATRGEVQFSCGPAVFPVVWRGSNPNPERPADLFQITLHYRSEQMLFSADGPLNPERFGLLAAHELIRRFRGQIHARPKPPGRQEISILIPLL
jgi:signal transduction histidine kinase